MADFLDLALVFDPESRTADCELGPDGDLLLDETPITPMLLSLGCDRRARPDDELPSGVDALNAPSSFVSRRGWVGDALDPFGRRIGSRLWLLDRAKESELTRMMVEEWASEALRWVGLETGRAAEITVAWVRRNILGLRCRVGRTEISTTLRAGG